MMYESFYGMREKPFSILPDPDLVYWGRSHRLGLAVLEFGVLNSAGFTVITGDIGSGKTTLVRYLLRRMDKEASVGLVSNTPRTRDELLAWVLMSFHQPFEGSYPVLLKRFQDFLYSEFAEGRHTVLIIDEAQNLMPDVLEELRMLSNINADKRQFLQLILVGQLELKTILQTPQLRQFAQRVTCDFHLKPLSAEEVPEYIGHRLSAVGAKRELFSEEACDLIVNASGGIPRLINILCDMSLVYSYSMGDRSVRKEVVRDVIEDKRKFGIFPMDGLGGVAG
uniref:AAA ATPase n=1 Tax=Rhodopseudomonas palustris (strain BisA53) TaxID=316055 RepID=Q07SP1_RHOP5